MSYIHIIDRDIRRRAAMSRRILELESHAEIYEDYSEFSERQVSEGLVLVAHADSRILLKLLADGKIQLPVIVYSEHPGTSQVVEAVQSGALDFLDWPANSERLRHVLDRAKVDGEQRVAQLRKRAAARETVRALSPRERDVLVGLLEGGSTKSIGMNLGISPRTVEIHRGNMMRKLRARSTGDAIRIAIYAGLDSEYEIAA